MCRSRPRPTRRTARRRPAQRRRDVHVDVPPVAAARGCLVEPEEVREAIARRRCRPQPVVPPECVDEEAARDRRERRCRAGRAIRRARAARTASVRVARRERHPRDPVAHLADDANARRRSSDRDLAAHAARSARVLHFACGCGRNEGVAVDLAVRMIDRGADLASTVLEHQHVFDLGPREQRLGAIGPQVDDLADLLGRRGSPATRRASVRTARLRHAPTAGGGCVLTRARRSTRPKSIGRARRERRPAVGEPAHVVGIGCFEAADTERAVIVGRFGRVWRWPTMLTHSPVRGSRRNSPGEFRRRTRSSRRHTCRMERTSESPRPQPAIRKMTVDDCPAVAKVQARAFFDDPLQAWALPDDLDAAFDPRAGVRVVESLFERAAR